MQSNAFTGNVAKAPVLSGQGERAVVRFTLISNEYAGRDPQTGEARQRATSIQFTAFKGRAEAIARHAMKGDQLFVKYRIQNNDYEKDGEKHYDYNFIVEDFEFGSAGKEKREQRAQQNSDA